MNRKDQRVKAATDYINSDVVPAMNMHMAFGDFLRGAEWAATGLEGCVKGIPTED